MNEPALLVLRFADPRRRDAPPERDLRELFFFCCSCAILYWFSVSLFPSVSRKRRYLQPLARVRRGRSHPRPGRPFPESDDAVIRVHPERGRCGPVRAVPLLSCPLRPWPVDRRPGRCSAGAWPSVFPSGENRPDFAADCRAKDAVPGWPHQGEKHGKNALCGFCCATQWNVSLLITWYGRKRITETAIFQ